MITRILIVDDKTENLYLLQSLLDSNGFRTFPAKNGAEALGLMRNIIPDLIITDILMPVMDGFTLCRECKKDEILKNIPFFFYSATYTDSKDLEYALSLGADRFIPKPQEPDVFVKVINDFFEELKKKSIPPKEIIQQPESVLLKEYNEVLIRKIEDKMLQTEKSEKELKKYAEELEKEIDKRKKNEESLIKSEEYNRLLFTSSPIGLFLCNMEGTLIDINPAFAKIIGRTSEETLKLSYWDITPEKYALQESERLKKLEETGRYEIFEKEYIHKDGHLVPVLMQGLILERDGERFIWSSVEDISQRKEAENALQKSQQLFQTLAHASPVGIFRTDPEGLTTYVNPKWMELSGLTFEEALDNGWLNAVHPEDRSKLYESWISNLKTINDSGAEYRFLRPDGSIVWVIGKAVPELAGNEIAGYVGTITDITNRKIAEKILQESEKKYHRIFENIQDLYFEISLEGIILEVSPSIISFTHDQYTQEDLIGKSMFEVYSDTEDLNLLLSALHKKGSINDYEVVLRNKDGSFIPCSISAKLCFDGQGEPEKMIGSIRDISERKLAELDLIKAKEKAEESDRLKTAFLHNISHEVRTPMNAIIGFSNLITDPDISPEIRNELIRTIVHSSNQLLSIITQIVNMATIETRQERMYYKNISLNSVLNMIFEQFSPEADRKNITLKYNTGLASGEDMIRTDETKLIQIISNLIGNALKFIKRGSVIFGYTLKDKYLEFYFQDTGIGIPPDMHKRIFERFMQVESGLSREYEGAGLGLSISKAYVELLGGKIWLTSEPGIGSVFYFTIPFSKISNILIRNKEITSGSIGKSEKTMTVLVAEDEDINVSLLAHYLSASNIELIHASNGIEAVEICRSVKKIDLVLMDLKMPFMNGFEAASKIREFLPALPILAQTAYSGDSDKEKALACGCNDLIIKPFRKEELLSLIMEYLPQITDIN